VRVTNTCGKWDDQWEFAMLDCPQRMRKSMMKLLIIMQLFINEDGVESILKGGIGII